MSYKQGDTMKYLSEEEFKKEMDKAKKLQRQYSMQRELREAKRRFPKLKKPNTSKLIVFIVFIICLQILWFSEHMVVKTGDTSYMYVLIGIPAALIPTLLGYFNKSKCENTVGGITYDMALNSMNDNFNVTDNVTDSDESNYEEDTSVNDCDMNGNMEG